jgi:hypothetical protein
MKRINRILMGKDLRYKSQNILTEMAFIKHSKRWHNPKKLKISRVCSEIKRIQFYRNFEI